MSSVLICEDDAFLAADLAMSVEASGHEVHGIYTNTRDALRSTVGRQPDVALIDLELADGHTGTLLARALEALGVRVIVVSGHPNTGTGLESIAHTYAAKPASRELVEHLLGVRRPVRHALSDEAGTGIAVAPQMR